MGRRTRNKNRHRDEEYTSHPDSNYQPKSNWKPKVIKPRNENQALYLDALENATIVVGSGSAGTGKSMLAVSVAVNKLQTGQVKKIIITRPVVEAGENLGFLPGDLKEKLDPYLIPIYDCLNELLPKQKVDSYLENKIIEIAPLAFMRGRTLSNAFIILDEAQNTSETQMKMFLTRLGEGSTMAINGDPHQIDLPFRIPSGLIRCLNNLRGIEGIEIIEFSQEDVVRHPMIGKILNRWG